MIHYLYIGHFEREGDFVRIVKPTPDSAPGLATTRPLDIRVVEDLLQQKGLSLSTIPAEWGLWWEDGLVVCDRFTQSREAIDFVAGLARRTGCAIADYSSQSMIRPEDLTLAWDDKTALSVPRPLEERQVG